MLNVGQANFPFTGLCVQFSVRKMYGLKQLAVKGLKYSGIRATEIKTFWPMQWYALDISPKNDMSGGRQWKQSSTGPLIVLLSGHGPPD